MRQRRAPYGVPERDRVEDQAEGADLVFHAVAVAAVQLSLLAVEDGLAVATEKERTLSGSVAAA